MNKQYGLREQIANAETEQEVLKLLQSGNIFEYANPRTKLSWKHTAQRRIKQLVTLAHNVTSSTENTDVKKTSLKKPKKFSKNR